MIVILGALRSVLEATSDPSRIEPLRREARRVVAGARRSLPEEADAGAVARAARFLV
jgi:hypothetical protein